MYSCRLRLPSSDDSLHGFGCLPWVLGGASTSPAPTAQRGTALHHRIARLRASVRAEYEYKSSTVRVQVRVPYSGSVLVPYSYCFISVRYEYSYLFELLHKRSTVGVRYVPRDNQPPAAAAGHWPGPHREGSSSRHHGGSSAQSAIMNEAFCIRARSGPPAAFRSLVVPSRANSTNGSSVASIHLLVLGCPSHADGQQESWPSHKLLEKNLVYVSYIKVKIHS